MGLWHTDGSPNLGQKTRPYNNQQQQKKKRICWTVDFTVLADHRIKLKECEKKDKYLDLTRELKKYMVHEGESCTSRDWGFWYGHQRIIKGTGGLRGQKMSRDHPNYNIIENGQNTEKSPGDLRRLVTQYQVKDHHLTLMWKTLMSK